MASREVIINNIRKAKLVDSGLPEFDFRSDSKFDWIDLFINSTKKAGSSIVQNKDFDCSKVKKVINLSNHLSIESTDLQGVNSPYELTDIDLLILDGEIGVAENAAIWVTSKNWPFRVLPFISEHLVICLKKDKIVGNMHDAYVAIGEANYDFGVFIAGPSKTADIEQSLVIGAQGAMSLRIILVD